ncbi:MAG: hypothetical protein ACE5MI_14270 [Acidimicrobiia bacterium]
MSCKIIVREGRQLRIHIGHVISWGPDTVHLLITSPQDRAGQTEIIDLSRIVKYERLAA